MYEQVLATAPQVPQFHETFARVLVNLGDVLVDSDNFDEGIDAYDAAEAQLQDLIDTYPGLSHIADIAARTVYRRGRAFLVRGDCDRAVEDFALAVFRSPELGEEVRSLITGESPCDDVDVVAEVTGLAEAHLDAVERGVAP